MRFEQRWNTTIPHQTPRTLLGELPLSHHDPNPAGASSPADRSTDDVTHLQYAGTHTISLSNTPILVEVNLVRQSGAPAFTGNCLVSMLPRDDPLSDTASFVSDWHQRIQLFGSTELEPGGLLGASSSLLAQVLIFTLADPSTDSDLLVS